MNLFKIIGILTAFLNALKSIKPLIKDKLWIINSNRASLPNISFNDSHIAVKSKLETGKFFHPNKIRV